MKYLMQVIALAYERILLLYEPDLLFYEPDLTSYEPISQLYEPHPIGWLFIHYIRPIKSSS
ncbi:hypothetical protein [Bacillus suaedae]|uniref:Uncharacterized protein n=1 Tax=Halalkalibacter suaedae TaxID=2822140 RepID=A0A941AN77_9BACI|nr:hypothetical protein [Bacillus suaedae]MBP3950007.1 hypothetical protein [Bacillus suaedae]